MELDEALDHTNLLDLLCEGDLHPDVVPTDLREVTDTLCDAWELFAPAMEQFERALTLAVVAEEEVEEEED